MRRDRRGNQYLKYLGNHLAVYRGVGYTKLHRMFTSNTNYSVVRDHCSNIVAAIAHPWLAVVHCINILPTVLDRWLTGNSKRHTFTAADEDTQVPKTCFQFTRNLAEYYGPTRLWARGLSKGLNEVRLGQTKAFALSFGTCKAIAAVSPKPATAPCTDGACGSSNRSYPQILITYFSEEIGDHHWISAAPHGTFDLLIAIS
ncbi:hypothetical protein EV127DRAFT_411883 [Xylaria flabelliformis]|nr:hypothetical protein EV127DRAFT_411883 [Xylaria flabelliformis]